MRTKIILTLLILISTVYAQDMQQRRGGSISGTVIEKGTGTPVEYANIVLFSSKDSSQITGTITDNEGKFNLSPLPPGQYYLNIQFIGFEKITKSSISINRNTPVVDVGVIELTSGTYKLGDVVVEGQKNPISYQIDRKVIDVNQMPVSTSGTAADVLENVPSVTVDIEGNVSLRGSQNFTVLIDGRPSVIDAQDILQQIPAGTIDNIEIITNPSAKYDPEGSSGIINIKLKKGKETGLSGVSNLNAGLNNKYGGDALVEYKSGDITANFGLDYNNRFNPGSREEDRRITLNGNTSYTQTDGEVERGRRMFGLRGGIEYRISQMDILSLSGRFGDRERRMSAFQNHFEWSDLNPQQEYFRNISRSDRGGFFYAINLNYQRNFNTTGHQLLSEFSFHKHDSDEESLTELFDHGVFVNGRRSTEAGPSDEFEVKLDYTWPINEKTRFEAGYQSEMEFSTENTGYYQADSSAVYNYFSQFSHLTKFNDQEHALYSTYSGSFGNFGYQLGLRGELTYHRIRIDNHQEFLIDEFDFFPGIHTSYMLSEGKQVMASYTRRIHRPHGWSLEPFETWTDANNVRRGNPALQPEDIDSYELGVSTFFGGLSLSLEGYYRMTHDKIEDIRSAYAENVTLTTFGNVGKDYSLGSEMMVNLGLWDFWDVRLMGNMYNYRIKGTLYNEPFERESFNWNTRFNNNLKFGDTQFQVTFSYNSPSVSAQGKREGFLTTDLAVKQDFMNRSLSLTLQVRDLFSTAKYQQTSSGPDFYSYSRFNMESPMLMLNLRFNINNFKNRQENRMREEDSEMDEGDGFQ